MPKPVTYGQIWWTSVWPLFVVSLLATFLVGGPTGVGGLGAAIIGSFLARSYVRHPVSSRWDAFKIGLVPASIFASLTSLFEIMGSVYYQLAVKQHLDPTFARLVGVGLAGLNAVVVAPCIAGVWALFIIPRVRRLAGAEWAVSIATPHQRPSGLRVALFFSLAIGVPVGAEIAWALVLARHSTRLESTSPVAAAPQETKPQQLEHPWGELEQASFRRDVLAGMEKTLRAKHIGNTISEETKGRVADCILRKAMRAFPGGSATLTMPKAASIGRDCMKEMGFDKNAAQWTPDVMAAQIGACVFRLGEAWRPWCRCNELEAAKRFGTPNAFFSAVQASTSDEHDRRLDALRSACKALRPPGE